MGISENQINEKGTVLILCQRNPSIQQRIEWHIEHLKNCGGRDIPSKFKAEMKNRNIKISK